MEILVCAPYKWKKAAEEVQVVEMSFREGHWKIKLHSQITTFDGYSKNMAVIFIDRLGSNQWV